MNSKIKSLVINSGYNDPELEKVIREKDAALKEQARKNAFHFAKKNLPALIGDRLFAYIGEIKTGYEELIAFIYHYLQPGIHFPEGKMDMDLAKEKDENLGSEIKKKEEQNRNDEYELNGHNPGNIVLLIVLALAVTAVIFTGDTVFNTKAFEVTGENRLFALILSVSISFAVLLFAHFSAFQYKKTRTPVKRRWVVFRSLAIVTLVFIALAVFRSKLLEKHNVSISPVYFVIINLFLFIVTAGASLYLLPTWEEIKENSKWLELYYANKKRKNEIEKLKRERESNKMNTIQTAKDHLRITYYANYLVGRVSKMYKETVEIFKSTNLIYRTDGKVPDCFHEEPPDLDVNHVTIYPTSSSANGSDAK